MELWQYFSLLAVVLISCICCIILIVKQKDRNNMSAAVDEISRKLVELEFRLNEDSEQNAANLNRSITELRTALNESMAVRFDSLGKQLTDRQSALESGLSVRLESQNKSVTDGLDGIRKSFEGSSRQSEERFKSFELSSIEQLKLITASLESNLKQMRESNDKKLDEIRGVVDEKLQRTLNERFNENFKLISERLTEVYKGLGEMQSLAAGVGDLKRVLSNVKTRGNLGELQLGAILEEILAPEQYERNFDAKKNSGNERVEFAIKMPSDDNESLYLPIDSKFPSDTYEALVTAYDSGDPDLVAAAKKTLSDTLRTCAKSIRDKYINPPRTTDFAIMFLPAEGLYAEAVRLGLIEKLQHDYKINIAGPSTMAVLLNSLRLGFQTLAIQKRSGDIWKILTEIRKEFETFGEVLEKTQKSLNTANTELEKMIGVRTRQIIKTLNKASSLNPDNQSDKKLMIDLE